jgi:NADPH2:quinone reductase
MKAVVCEQLGPPEALRLRDVDIPPPGLNEVQIRIEACGINFPDLLIIQGKYQEQPELPFIPCGEVAGVVEAVGAGVLGYKPGDAVMAVTYRGGLAEFVNVPAAQVQHRPAGMSAQAAAAFPGVFGTSYHALKQRAELQPGETLLVLGAAGGVGHAAVQLGAAMGARVIAAVSSDDKVAYLKAHGASEVINYQSTDMRTAVKALTGGEGADVIYDPVGGDAFDQAMRCINWNGRLLVVGFASGRIPQLPVNLALLKGAAVVGVFYGRFEQEEPEAATQNRRELAQLYQDGRIAPAIHQTFALEDYAAALNALTGRQVIGKVVVTISQGHRPMAST